MKFNARIAVLGMLLETLAQGGAALGQETKSAGPMRVEKDIAYAEPKNERQAVDVYAPPGALGAKNLPVVVWIHGGGWQSGDRTQVQVKPQAFVDKGFVFVSVGYRLWPKVTIEQITQDVAKSIRWVHDHIAERGGDPNRLLVMGHSAGAQLAALVCTDDRYLKAEGLSLAIIKGCVPVDGDTYDLPLEIAMETESRKKLGKPDPKTGHRAKFGEADRQRELSAVTHVARDKGIPPFLLLFVAEHPETSAQAKRLASVLTDAAVPAKLFGAADTNHVQLNANLGVSGDPATAALFEFTSQVLKK
jgi:acetyl esterase/lipase